jgi:site-specific DNA-methyltransferase (adenine-specific)
MNIQLINDDCLDALKDLSDNSIDLLFCDLPYGETSCKWDCLIDLELFWKEINRVCKDTTPMFFTCSTKFGVSLINSNPKNFRYDLVWVKSASCGFLNAKKMPMRKHEMVYVFYRKLPYYDLSSHKHKFIKERKPVKAGEHIYKDNVKSPQSNYDPPLPNSVIKTEELCYSMYNKEKGYSYEIAERKNGEPRYDPPLPNSVIKTELYSSENKEEPRELYRNEGGQYEPPLPNSLLEIKSEKGKHPTQKPTDLIKWCLKYYSKEGDTILDPTMGSGSTGVACKSMNRNFIGIEKDLKIFKIAEERIND